MPDETSKNLINELTSKLVEKIFGPPDLLEGSIMNEPITIKPERDPGYVESPMFGLSDFTPAGDALALGESIKEKSYLGALAAILSMAIPGTLRVRNASDVVKATVRNSDDALVYKALDNEIARRQYESAMGFSQKNDYASLVKNFAEEAYPFTEAVVVRHPDGFTHVDAIKGLNRGHALKRAAINWEGAQIIPIDIEPPASFLNDFDIETILQEVEKQVVK